MPQRALRMSCRSSKEYTRPTHGLRRRAHRRAAASARPGPPLSVVAELQRDGDVFCLAQHLDHSLKLVLAAAGDPQLVALDARLDFVADAPDPLLHVLGQGVVDSRIQLDLDLTPAPPDRLWLARLEELGRKPRAAALCDQDLAQRPGAVLGRGFGHDHAAAVLQARLGALEVEPGAGLATGLVERVRQLGVVVLGDDVEAELRQSARSG